MDMWLAPEAVEDSSEPVARRPGVNADEAWGGFEVSHRIRYTHRFAFDEPGPAMDRSSLNLPQDACVWVTVGTRLHTELTPTWVGAVRQVLDRNPRARWLLVGQESQQLQGLGLDHPQILIRPFERRVQNLLKACDLYLNPPRRGGGHSLACAMFTGLAVLSMRTGDGGDKVGPWGAADAVEFFDRLHRLSTQQDELRALAGAMRQRFEQTFDMSRAGDFLLQAMQRTRDCGASRLR
jgi:glycosyltransferase involved in cell wall biosynthesis